MNTSKNSNRSVIVLCILSFGTLLGPIFADELTPSSAPSDVVATPNESLPAQIAAGLGVEHDLESLNALEALLRAYVLQDTDEAFALLKTGENKELCGYLMTEAIRVVAPRTPHRAIWIAQTIDPENIDLRNAMCMAVFAQLAVEGRFENLPLLMSEVADPQDRDDSLLMVIDGWAKTNPLSLAAQIKEMEPGYRQADRYARLTLIWGQYDFDAMKAFVAALPAGLPRQYCLQNVLACCFNQRPDDFMTLVNSLKGDPDFDVAIAAFVTWVDFGSYGSITLSMMWEVIEAIQHPDIFASVSIEVLPYWQREQKIESIRPFVEAAEKRMNEEQKNALQAALSQVQAQAPF
jgi:hypothetical protein